MQQQQHYLIPFDEKLLKELDSSYSHDQLINLLKNQRFNLGLGCIFGACLGDALGSYCELTRNVTINELSAAMKMEGGGTFPTYPGQFTDDSELALHLIEGLCIYNKKQKLHLQTNRIILKIAMQYVKWYQSQPFDIGDTCKKAFSTIRKFHLENIQGEKPEVIDATLQKMLNEISKKNKQSESNGSLMRIAPMAFFASFINDPDVYDLIKRQISLTHSNQKVTTAGQIWVQLLSELIKRTTNNKEQLLQIRQTILSQCKQTMEDWILEANKISLMEANRNMIGWSKIAWTMGFNLLRDIANEGISQDTYKRVMQDVIRCGGDTDTNATIVGGMVGSLVGFKGLPGEYLKKAMEVQFPKEQKRMTDREFFYQPKTMLLKAIQLFKQII